MPQNALRAPNLATHAWLPPAVAHCLRRGGHRLLSGFHIPGWLQDHHWLPQGQGQPEVRDLSIGWAGLVLGCDGLLAPAGPPHLPERSNLGPTCGRSLLQLRSAQPCLALAEPSLRRHSTFVQHCRAMSAGGALVTTFDIILPPVFQTVSAGSGCSLLLGLVVHSPLRLLYLHRRVLSITAHRPASAYRPPRTPASWRCPARRGPPWRAAACPPRSPSSWLWATPAPPDRCRWAGTATPCAQRSGGSGGRV